MIEIHYHLLYGVDDGPRDLAASLALAEASIAEGVTHIVATPHANFRYGFDPSLNRAKLEELNQRLTGRVTLGLGCDFHLSIENVADAFEHPAEYTINGGRYLLVEFPDFAIPPNFSDVLYKFTLRGIVPIVTHPERNPVLLTKPELMKPWIRCGCLVQITAASLVGKFGGRAQSFCHQILKKNWVHLVASDAHSVDRRPPMMEPACKSLTKAYGSETAERLCTVNTRAVFEGQALPEQPEPQDLDDYLPSRPHGILSMLFPR